MENYRYFIRIPNHLGDTIMAQPAVEAFQLNENEKTVLMMPDWAKPIYKKEGNVKIIALPSNRRHGFSAVLFQVRELRKYKIETGILLTPSFSSRHFRRRWLCLPAGLKTDMDMRAMAEECF